MKPALKKKEPNRSEIILHEQLALKRIKELRHNQWPEHWRHLWLLALELRAALLKAPELERQIAPEQAQPRHEWDQQKLIARLL